MVKSLKINMLLNAIKGCMSVVFPLITFPYVSHVLDVEGIGQYNFSVSIVSYFILLAGLGINTYAIREGARIREDNNAIVEFACEMYTINLISTVISYILLIILVLCVPRLFQAKTIIAILSLQIFFSTFGVEWIYSIFEDYLFITIRSIIIQILSLVLVFTLVREPGDVDSYAWTTTISVVATQIFNHFYARKYCIVKLNKAPKPNWKKHIKPVLVLFAMSATVTIYVSSDSTMLGFLSGDYSVGIYSVSTKVYNVVKTVLSSVIVVSIPRISAMLDNKKLVQSTAEDIYSTLLTVTLPSCLGLVLLSHQIISILSTERFNEAYVSLCILAIALFFSMGAYFWGQAVLVPYRQEKTVFKITIVSALLNVGLNFILIPLWQQNAASLTTAISEGVSFLFCYIYGRKFIKTDVRSNFVKICIGCIAISAVDFLLMKVLVESSKWIITVVIVLVSVMVYGIIELALKNTAMNGLIRRLQRK